MNIRRKNICYIWMLNLALFTCGVCGCSQEQNAGKQMSEQEEEIELLDPVGVAVSYDVAQVRDLYEAEVYSCVCAPAITEFAYNTDLPFEKYGKLPGESVASGNVLVYGDTISLDESYDQLSEEVEDKVEDYQDEINNLQEDLYDAEKAEYEALVLRMANLDNKPAEGAYKAAVMVSEKIEQSIKEKEELFALELEYEQGKLGRIADKIEQAQVTSNMAGTVVAINTYSSDDIVQKNMNVIAVGDTSKKALHTKYISKAAVEKAVDIYAVIDGKRYEVIYENMEKEEYNRLKKVNGSVCTTFYLNDPNDEIVMGKYAALVFVKKSSMNTLAVLSNSLYKDGQDYFCYLYDGEQSTITPVTVGMTDGMYTEILSGLKEGDKVLTEKAISAKDKTHTLKSGSLAYEYLGNGTLFYPSKEWISNPAKEGSFYLKEICVEKYQQVEAGQELAKIEVISDEISIKRIERKIQRQQERLNKLFEERNVTYSEDAKRVLDRSIKSRQKAIEDLTEDLNDLTKYTDVITLTAPYAGIITSLTDIEVGELISYKEKLVEMADQTQCYIMVEDETGQLSYGNEVTISLMLGKSVEKEIKGTVVTVNPSALTKQMQTNKALILLSEENVAEIAKYGSTVNSDGDWSRNRFEVRTQIRTIDNVILVPQNAVTIVDENTFVKVKDSDGIISYVSFISGGLEQNYYWAADGLSEGMEICLE